MRFAARASGLVDITQREVVDEIAELLGQTIDFSNEGRVEGVVLPVEFLAGPKCLG